MTPKVLLHHKEHVEDLLELLTVLANKETREDFIQRNITKIAFLDKSEAKKNRLEFGYFSKQDVVFMMHVFLKKKGKPDGVNTQVVNLTINQLVLHLVILDASTTIENEYQINSDHFLSCQANNTLDSIVFGLLYTLEKYKRSIPAINVITKENDEHCGSGLLVKINSNILGVLTNAHVIENNTVKNIKAGDLEYTLAGDPIISSVADLAFLPVEVPSIYTPNFILSKAEILKTVIAIGYPKISAAVDQYALFHKGEVNGEIQTIDGKTFLAISCHVSPGNSGGPLISEIGELVGMVTQSNTGEYMEPGGQMRVNVSTYNMAIPSNIISQFLSTLSD